MQNTENIYKLTRHKLKYNQDSGEKTPNEHQSKHHNHTNSNPKQPLQQRHLRNRSDTNYSKHSNINNTVNN